MRRNEISEAEHFNVCMQLMENERTALGPPADGTAEHGPAAQTLHEWLHGGGEGRALKDMHGVAQQLFTQSEKF